MIAEQTTRFSPSREKACDDMPVAHRPLPDKALRIILADDHPVVLLGAEMALGDSFSIVAQGPLDWKIWRTLQERMSICW